MLMLAAGTPWNAKQKHTVNELTTKLFKSPLTGPKSFAERGKEMRVSSAGSCIRQDAWGFSSWPAQVIRRFHPEIMPISAYVFHAEIMPISVYGLGRPKSRVLRTLNWVARIRPLAVVMCRA